MLGDITPVGIKLTTLGAVYTGHDNVFGLHLQKLVGRRYVTLDVRNLQRVVLIVPRATEQPAVFDSDLLGSVFDWEREVGTIFVDLSAFDLAPGSYSAQLIVYDAEHPRGQVLCDGYVNPFEFMTRYVDPQGTVPPPVQISLTDAPTDGKTYARRDGAWVEVSIDGLDELITAVAELQENNATLNAQVLDLQERVTALEQGQPVVPPNALSDASGQILVDSSGETLLLGDVLTSNVLVDSTSTPLVDSGTNELTAGE